MYESPVQTALEQYGRRLERLIPAGFVEELAYFPKLEIIGPLPLVNPKTGEVQEFTHCQPRSLLLLVMYTKYLLGRR